MADARPFHWEYVPEPVTREVFRVEGGRPLSGSVPISGAKNAALKMLAAATLTGERCRITNVPEIEDVRVMAQTLIELGVVVDHPEENVYEVAAGDVEWQFVPLEAAAKMRASFMLLGPLLARFGRVIISNPGGDRIGRRPVNLHVDAMRSLGAEIEYRNGYYFATAPGRLRGGEVRFPFVSVMGTENAMLAATLADGHTVIRPAAQEPEVDDLIAFLQKMGAQIERTHADTIEVDGKRRLRGAEHRVIPDRIEAGTFVIAGAVTGGRITLTRRAVRPPRRLPRRRRAHRSRDRAVAPTPSMSMARRSPNRDSGRSISRRVPIPASRPTSSRPRRSSSARRMEPRTSNETIFEDRLDWMSELQRMGGKIEDRRPPPRGHHRPLTAPWRGGRDRRSAGRSVVDPRRAGSRGRDHHPRCAPRSPGL